MSFSVNRQVLIGPSIIAILLLGYPSTISRFVVSVIVYSVNALSFWTFSHVIEKVRVIFPSFANRNASVTIPFSTSILRVAASSDHTLPNMIGFGICCITPLKASIVFGKMRWKEFYVLSFDVANS